MLPACQSAPILNAVVDLKPADEAAKAAAAKAAEERTAADAKVNEAKTKVETAKAAADKAKASRATRADALLRCVLLPACLASRRVTGSCCPLSGGV